MLEPSKDESHYDQEHYMSIADVSGTILILTLTLLNFVCVCVFIPSHCLMFATLWNSTI